MIIEKALKQLMKSRSKKIRKDLIYPAHGHFVLIRKADYEALRAIAEEVLKAEK